MDKYAKAIEHLTEHPDQINDAWNHPNNHVAGCLFDYADKRTGDDAAGCLTMIRANNELHCIETMPELNQRILSDKRIPTNVHDITVDNLHVFAEWQRELDKIDVRK